ncbi:MAG: MBL fold metallo-hydrolase [bacterium]
MEIVFDRGIHLPEIELWLDPHEAMPDATAFVSHAHGDHARWHGTTLASSPTLRLMRARENPPKDCQPKPQAFLQRFKHGNAMLTLLPAGHVAGSSQILIEYKKERLIYSGDFKLRPDPACEPIQVREADQLITETTFGQAQYLFPPASKTIERIAAFVQKAHKDRKVPVLLAYSLGKAQELMLSLKPWNWEFVLHPSIATVSEAYKGLGYAMPPFHVSGNTGLDNKVLLWPPDGRRHAWYSSISARCRTAFISGWAMDSGARTRFGVDEAFPLSDHADFSELLAYVWQVHPKKIHTQHGFAAEFAAHLRLTGHDASPLGGEEQLELL